MCLYPPGLYSDCSSMVENQNLLSANFMIFGFHLKLVLQAVLHMISLSARYSRPSICQKGHVSDTKTSYLHPADIAENQGFYGMWSKCLSVVINCQIQMSITQLCKKRYLANKNVCKLFLGKNLEKGDRRQIGGFDINFSHLSELSFFT